MCSSDLIEDRICDDAFRRRPNGCRGAIGGDDPRSVLEALEADSRHGDIVGDDEVEVFRAEFLCRTIGAAALRREADEKGRIRLSMKAVLEEGAAPQA